MHSLLTISDVLSVTKMSKASVYRRVADGSFPQPVRVGPRSIRFVEAEVEDWLTELANGSRLKANLEN